MSIAASDIIAAGKRVGIDAETLLALVAEIDAQKAAERREGAAERQRRKRERAAELPPDPPVTPVTHVTDVTRNCVTDAPRARVVISNPPTEDSYIKNPPSEGKKGRDLSVAARPEADGVGNRRAARATRIPDDWTPGAEGLDFAAAALGSPEAAGREAEKFRDYWRGVPGSRGVKLDWPGTWRNWIRRTAENAPKSRGQPLPTRQRGPSFADLMRDLTNAERSDDFTGDAAGNDRGQGGGLRGGPETARRGVVVDLRPQGSGWG